MEEKLTVTEQLIMEVLAARYRTGENTWTFNNNVTKQLKSLEEKGLVGFKSAVVEKHKLAWMDDKGKKMFLSDSYIPPNP